MYITPFKKGQIERKNLSIGGIYFKAVEKQHVIHHVNNGSVTHGDLMPKKLIMVIAWVTLSS